MINHPNLAGIQKWQTDTYLVFKFIYTFMDTYIHTHKILTYTQQGLRNTTKEVTVPMKWKHSGTKYCNL